LRNLVRLVVAPVSTNLNTTVSYTRDLRDALRRHVVPVSVKVVVA